MPDFPPFGVSMHYMDIDTEPEEEIKIIRKSLRVQKKPAELYECKLIACGFTTFEKKEFEQHCNYCKNSCKNRH